jgi:thymidylate synthase
MRIYNDPLEMVKEVERDLYEMGIQLQSHTVQDECVNDNPDYQSLELMGYGYILTGDCNTSSMIPMLEYLNGNKQWCDAEFQERISQRYINPGTAWKLRPEIWEKYLHEGKFAYTYNQRYIDQLPVIIRELKQRPNTRQAVMTVYSHRLDQYKIGGIARIPCSMYYHFMIRRDKLNIMYYQRSCDFLKHFVHDVYLTAKLHEYVAEQIGVPVGTFIHNIGSLHAFKIDLDKRGIF